jgi:hypothetical protein
MASMVDQLCDSCRTFAEQTGAPEWGMAGYLLFYSGGALAPNVPREGIPTLEQARDWLSFLIRDRLFDEEFVARGLARRIEDEFEGMFEDYAVGLRRRRKVLDLAVSRGMVPEDEMEAARSFAAGSLDEMKRRREDLEAWRKAAGSLLGRE